MAYKPPRKDHDSHFDLIGFAPDLDVDIPGACSVMTNLIPTTRGWGAMPGLDATDRYAQQTAAYATNPVQAYFSRTGHAIIRVGAQAIRQSALGTANTATGGLTIGTALPSAFLDYGVYVLMANLSHTIATLSNNTFVAVTGAPTGMGILVGAARFVVAFDNNFGWRCCARDNVASWTLSPATLAASGSLPGLPDDTNKTAAAMGDDIILFKGQTVYRGRFVVGDEEVWVWDRLPIDINAHFFQASCSYKNGVLALADDGLYFYDGTGLTNLMDERMSRWFAKRVLLGVYFNTVVVDEVRDLIWISVLMYDSDTLTTYVTRVFVCDPKNKRWALWGGAPITGVQSGFHYTPGSWTGLGYSQRSNLRTPWALNSTSPYRPREIGAVATAASAAYVTMNFFGDSFIDTEVKRASVKFTRAPTGAQEPIITGKHGNTLDGSFTTDTGISRATDGLFDIHQSGRWHQLALYILGDFEFSGIAIDSEPVSRR